MPITLNNVVCETADERQARFASEREAIAAKNAAALVRVDAVRAEQSAARVAMESRHRAEMLALKDRQRAERADHFTVGRAARAAAGRG